VLRAPRQYRPRSFQTQRYFLRVEKTHSYLSVEEVALSRWFRSGDGATNASRGFAMFVAIVILPISGLNAGVGWIGGLWRGWSDRLAGSAAQRRARVNGRLSAPPIAAIRRQLVHVARESESRQKIAPQNHVKRSLIGDSVNAVAKRLRAPPMVARASGLELWRSRNVAVRARKPLTHSL
jgi:hypothetical protein